MGICALLETGYALLWAELSSAKEMGRDPDSHQLCEGVSPTVNFPLTEKA